MGCKFLARGVTVLLLGAAFAFPTILATPPKGASQHRTEAKPRSAGAVKYPESAIGLKNQLQDWFALIKAGDAAKTAQYSESFVIPNHQEWFVRTFGTAEGIRLDTKYTESQTKFEEALAARTKRAVQAEQRSVKVRLFDKSACGQPPELHALSAAMVRSTPIYRAFSSTDGKDNAPSFLGNFIYIDSGFRYFDQRMMQALSTTPPMRISLTKNALSVPACGGPVKALYPPLARQTRTQGTVVLHAIIGIDGSIKELQVVSGRPLLIQSAMDAVQQWSYKPTLRNGKPVEVETEIDVVFALAQ